MPQSRDGFTQSFSFTQDNASYRHGAGHVFVAAEEVYRTVTTSGLADFHAVREKKILPILMREEKLIPEIVLSLETLLDFPEDTQLVLQHPKLPFISYPYEWPFSLLKAAALLQLDIHLRCLQENINLLDASAYNIQFQGCKPIFIDSLSFAPYKEGEYWLGHKQFCEQFLNPLLLQSLLGVSYHAWYKGAFEGIPTVELNKLIPWYKSIFSWNLMTQVVLQANLQSKNTSAAREIKAKPFPKIALVHMLKGLKTWISKLDVSSQEKTVWQDYEKNHSYDEEEVKNKSEFITTFVKNEKITTLWDLGCNTGYYSELSIKAGVKKVIGFDSDLGALEGAVDRAQQNNLDFLPLYQDLTNPSAGLGFAEKERKGLQERSHAQGLLALALIHHLAIGKNVPLPKVIDWLLSLAPKGVIEFVPKNDPMVVKLLSLREDIFEDYTEENFLKVMNQRAKITHSQHITKTKRLLVSYER